MMPRMTGTSSETLRFDAAASAFVERHERLVVAGVVLAGLALRLVHFLQIEANDPFFYHPSVDPRVYHEWAARIAGGDWVGDEVFFLAPLYPYLLALLYKAVGVSLWAARLVQLVMGAGVCALVYLLGKRTLGAATGALAAAVWAVYSMSIFYDGVLVVAAIQTPLGLMAALAFTRASSKTTIPSWAIVGALIGLGALARPNGLLLLLPVLAWMALSLRRRVSKRRLAALALAVCGLSGVVILPATVHNCLAGGDLVLVSAQGGANFYIGNGPGATGVFRVPAEFPPTRGDDPEQQREAFERVAEADLGQDALPSEVSRFWWRKAWSHIAEHPGDWGRLLAVKLGLFVNSHEQGNSRDYPSSREYSKVLLLPLPTFAAIAPLALLGMALAWRRAGARSFVLYAVVGVYAATSVAFFVLSHYRMPAVPFLVLFAANAVLWILEAASRRRLLALIMAAAALAAAVGVTQVDLVDEAGDRFIVHYNLGNKYRLLGRNDMAVREYERSISLNPDYISSHHNLALLAEGMGGRRERAIEAWRRVLELGVAARDARYVEGAKRHLRQLAEPGGKAPAPPPSPLGGPCLDCNVLLLTIETLRADHLECLGYGREVAPNLCALGAQGLLFERAYTPAPVTAPALRSIMTDSLVPNEDMLEILAHHDGLETLASKLAARGYATVGFTDHRGLGDLSSPRPKSAAMLRGFGEFTNLGEGRTGKTSARVAAAIGSWLEARGSDRFFLWAHLFDPHYNWVPEAGTAAAMGYEESRCGRVRHGMDIEDLRALGADMTGAEVRCLRALYDAEVRETDALLGGVLRRLAELGLAGNTLVVVAGDHGEEFLERGRIGHEWTLHDELLRVPLIIRNPASGEKGRRAEPVSTMAIHRYVEAAVAGRRAEVMPAVVSRTFHYYGLNTQDPSLFNSKPNDISLVDGRYKIIRVPGEGYRLYDLAADPAERVDLWGRDPAGKRLAEELEGWIRGNRAHVDRAKNDALQDYLEMAQRLKALGYTR